jgi:5'-nucleotidase
MRILIVNDDGMQAAQLPNLVRWARKFGDVTVFVPKFEQSGKSHSFEIRRDIEVKQVPIAEDVTVWSVDSTPADCVRIAVLAMKLKFDLCISGVNRGFNMGAEIMYSGTCAAAYEAVNLGIPAIALSTSFENYPNATEELDRVWEFIHSRKLLSVNNLYNVNIPPQPRGFRITRQGGPFYSDDFPHVGNHMYRPTGKPIWQDSQDDTLDTDATLHGYITITPLQLDRTNKAVYEQLQALEV